MQITEERLKIMEQHGKHGNVTIEDIYDNEMKPDGTKVIIELPVTTFTKV
jgi:hypothetical protein